MSTVSLMRNPLPGFSTALANVGEKIPGRESLQWVFDRMLNNPFFWTSLATVGGIALCVTVFVLLPPLAACGITVVVLGVLVTARFFTPEETRKWIFSETSLALTRFCSCIAPGLTQRPQLTQITDQLMLGGVPLKGAQYPKGMKPTAVLSMIESFETDPHFFGTPMQPKDWKAAGVRFLDLPNLDCTPVRNRDVKRGVKFLHEQISKGRRVLVHCLAGVGRSATVVICYLIKHQGMSPKEAAAFVREKRRISADENSPAIRHFSSNLGYC